MQGNIHLAEIEAFLRGPYCEGPQQLRGYIPCKLTTGGTANYRGGPDPELHVPMGQSGVTIATGVDLGQQDAVTLLRLGLDAGSVNQLRPYLGRRKAAAVQALHRLPLVISREFADALDHCIMGHHADIISRRYDQDAGNGAYVALPPQAQAVIFSACYQYGLGFAGKYPDVWRALAGAEWSAASRMLRERRRWGDYANRRAREGALLAQLVRP